MSCWVKVLDKWRLLPVVGPLAFCTKKDHGAALKEFIISVSFASAAFWVSAIVFRLFKSNAGITYMSLLRSTVSNGELLIFAVSFLGPVFLTAVADQDEKRGFPGRAWHLYALVALAGISALIFAVNKAFNSVTFPEPLGAATQLLDKDLIVSSSLWLAGLSMTLRYLTIVYLKSMQMPDETMRLDDLTFADRWAKHRGIKK